MSTTSAVGQVLGAAAARPVPLAEVPEGTALAVDWADPVGDAVDEGGAPDASPPGVVDVTPGLAAGGVAAPLPYAAAAALPPGPVPVVWDADFPLTRPVQAQTSSPATLRPPTSAKNRRRQYASAEVFRPPLRCAF
ncbi:MAG: hypothetical protein ACLPKE_23620 [Streptosporangiaceae bacterium]